MPEWPHVAADARQLRKAKRGRRHPEAIQHRPEGDLTPEQAEELRRLEAMGDGGIDTDAIPPAPAEAWRHARRGPVTRRRSRRDAPILPAGEAAREPAARRRHPALVQGARARLADRDQPRLARAHGAERVVGAARLTHG